MGHTHKPPTRLKRVIITPRLCVNIWHIRYSISPISVHSCNPTLFYLFSLVWLPANFLRAGVMIQIYRWLRFNARATGQMSRHIFQTESVPMFVFVVKCVRHMSRIIKLWRLKLPLINIQPKFSPVLAYCDVTITVRLALGAKLILEQEPEIKRVRARWTNP